MRKIILFVACLALAGCANLKNAVSTLEGATVSPRAVYVAVNAFDSIEVTATTYLRVCHKAAAQYQVCVKPIETQVVSAVRSGRKARNDLRAFLSTHNTALGAQGLYDALVQATNTLSSIVNTYNLGAVK